MLDSWSLAPGQWLLVLGSWSLTLGPYGSWSSMHTQCNEGSWQHIIYIYGCVGRGVRLVYLRVRPAAPAGIWKSGNLRTWKWENPLIYTLLVGVWGLTLRSAHSYFLVAQILSLKLRMTEPSRLEVSPGSMHKKNNTIN